MAVVYRAFDTRLERDVAVKFIRREAFSPEMLARVMERFEREAKTLGRLTHPNIVPVIDFGEHEGAPYLVMPYLPGGTLKDKLGRPMPARQAARLLVPVADALTFAHNLGIIHRDVKPANILLTGDERAMITDFGIAKLLLDHDGGTLTGTGVGIGTPEYMAPEQGLGQPVDGRADIYALGVVFYELVTGARPYSADTPMAVVLKHVTDPLPRARDFAPDLPEQAEKILLKAMAKRPEDRYQRMEEFAQALDDLAEGRPLREIANIPVVPQWQTTEFTVTGGGETVELGSQIKRQIEEGLTNQPASGTQVAVPAPAQPPAAAPKPAAGAPASPAAPPAAVRSDLFTVQPPKKKKRASAWLWLLLLPLAAGLAYLFLPGLLAPAAAPYSPANQPAVSEAPPADTPTPETPSEPSPTAEPAALPLSQDVPACSEASADWKDANQQYLRCVPAGAFEMGAAQNGTSLEAEADEYPQHRVFVDAFWIDMFEVYGKAYYRCVEAGYCSPSVGFDSNSIKPVVNISWYAAQKFCEWRGGRLPTEAEWEKAARGDDGRVYPWGNNAWDGSQDNLADANVDLEHAQKEYNDGYAGPAPVDVFPDGASPFGILGMGGNVREWVYDRYAADYYASSPERNPSGPTSGNTRVVRGGSWQDLSRWNARVSDRGWASPESQSDYIGFRCVIPAP